MLTSLHKIEVLPERLLIQVKNHIRETSTPLRFKAQTLIANLKFLELVGLVTNRILLLHLHPKLNRLDDLLTMNKISTWTDTYNQVKVKKQFQCCINQVICLMQNKTIVDPGIDWVKTSLN